MLCFGKEQSERFLEMTQKKAELSFLENDYLEAIRTCKLYLEKSYVPALIYIIVMSVSFDLQKLSPPLVASTFILFALNSVLKQTETSQINTNHSFEIGFFIGLGLPRRTFRSTAQWR